MSHMTDFELFLRSVSHEPAHGERARDIFPLPLIDIAVCEQICDRVSFARCGDVMLAIKIACLAIRCLNIMSGYWVDAVRLGRCAPQRAVQGRAFCKAVRLCEQLECQEPHDGMRAWQKLVHDSLVPG